MSDLLRYSLEDLLYPSEDADWLLHPFLAQGSLMQIYGRQGTGKSTLLAQLAHAFHTGEPWMGFQINITGPSIMLQLDMAKGDLSKFVKRAIKNGLNLDGLTFFGAPEGFNIRSKSGQASLREECDKIKPVAVLCDTINDSFGRQMDSNEEVRHILHTFQRCIGNAALIFTNHTRKKGAYVQAMESKQGAAFDDPDAFSGFGAFEQVATSSICLAEWNDGYRLIFQKHRLENPGFKEISLIKNGYGFFRPNTLHTQMLLQWPISIPEERRAEVVERCTSIRSVCDEIGELTGVKAEAVRQTYYRMKRRGVDALSPLQDE